MLACCKLRQENSRQSFQLVLKTIFNWFPTVVRSSPPERYYTLEEDMVFVPFHSIFAEMERNRPAAGKLVEEESQGEASGNFED